MATKNTSLHYAKGNAVRDAIETYNEGGLDALLGWKDQYSDIGTGKQWLDQAAGMGMAGADNQWQPEEVESLLNKSVSVWGGAPKEAKFGRVTDKLKEYAPYIGMAAGLAFPGALGALGSVGKILQNPLTGMALNAAGAKTFGGALSGYGMGEGLGKALNINQPPPPPKNLPVPGNIFTAMAGALSGKPVAGQPTESDALTGLNEMFQGTPMGLELLGLGKDGPPGKPMGGGKQIELNPAKWNWQDLLGLDGDAAMGPVKGVGAQVLGGLGLAGLGGGLMDLIKGDKGLPPAAQMQAPVAPPKPPTGGGGGVGMPQMPNPYQYQQTFNPQPFQMTGGPQAPVQPFKTQAYRGY